MSLNDDYRLLELSASADEADAKTAYRRLARLYHPDKNPNDDTTETFQQLQAAYQNVLAAIRQGVIVKDWQTYDFSSAKYNTKTQKTANDDLQKSYIKERQKAYEELKRNTVKQDKARDDAIRVARETLNEKRVKKMYEEAFRASQQNNAFNSRSSTYDNQTRHKEQAADDQIDDFIHHYQPEFQSKSEQSSPPRPVMAISHKPLKSALMALSYLIFFVLGIYGTLYWQSAYEDKAPEQEIKYISGLYPQFRQGSNYALADASLFASPELSAEVVTDVLKNTDVVVTGMPKKDWVTVNFEGMTGWMEAQKLGFGSYALASLTGCYGQPGVVPEHGSIIDRQPGNSRLRILNSLQTQSYLVFESYDGRPPFAVFLHAGQAFAANFIPRGEYRLRLETGSLYHRGCSQFLFNNQSQVVMERISFASTEMTLSLLP